MKLFASSTARRRDHLDIFAEFSFHLMGLLLARRAGREPAGSTALAGGDAARPPRFRVVQ